MSHSPTLAMPIRIISIGFTALSCIFYHGCSSNNGSTQFFKDPAQHNILISLLVDTQFWSYCLWVYMWVCVIQTYVCVYVWVCVCEWAQIIWWIRGYCQRKENCGVFTSSKYSNYIELPPVLYHFRRNISSKPIRIANPHRLVMKYIYHHLSFIKTWNNNDNHSIITNVRTSVRLSVRFTSSIGTYSVNICPLVCSIRQKYKSTKT